MILLIEKHVVFLNLRQVVQHCHNLMSMDKQRVHKYLPWEPNKLPSEVGPPQLMEYKGQPDFELFLYSICIISSLSMYYELMISRRGPPF